MIGSDVEARVRADVAHRLVAVHLRHHDVHEDDVDVGRRLQLLDRHEPVLGVDDLERRGSRARWSWRRCCARRRRRRGRAGRPARGPRARAAGGACVAGAVASGSGGAAAPPSASPRPCSTGAPRCARRSTRWRNSAVSCSSRSCDLSARLDDQRLDLLLEPLLLVAAQVLAGVDDDRQVLVPHIRCDLLDQVEPVNAGSTRSMTTQSKPLLVERRQRVLAVATDDRLDVVAGAVGRRPAP